MAQKGRNKVRTICVRALLDQKIAAGIVWSACTIWVLEFAVLAWHVHMSPQEASVCVWLRIERCKCPAHLRHDRNIVVEVDMSQSIEPLEDLNQWIAMTAVQTRV